MSELRPTRVKHMANIGDIIASLAGIKKYYEITGRKVIYSQQLNVAADYYLGAVHPTLDDSGSGKQVMCNQKMFEMIRPLLKSQEYIHDMEVFTGQPINFDLDVIRRNIFVNIPNQAIQQWTFMAYPDMAADLSKVFLEINDVDISNCFLIDPFIVTKTVPIEDLENKVIVNFTERYRNALINYYFLKKYEDRLIFSGTQKEYQLFTQQWGLNIPLLIVNNFLELAQIIKKAKFLLSNQSFQWNMSFAMKTPHILELCEGAPNCQAFFYEKSLAFLHQKAVGYYFELLLK